MQRRHIPTPAPPRIRSIANAPASLSPGNVNIKRLAELYRRRHSLMPEEVAYIDTIGASDVRDVFLRLRSEFIPGEWRALKTFLGQHGWVVPECYARLSS